MATALCLPLHSTQSIDQSDQHNLFILLCVCFNLVSDSSQLTLNLQASGMFALKI